VKIVALGPFYPYKGGIAQFTVQMSKALSSKNEVVNVSYSMQYPKILFPRGKQKDYSNTALKLDDVKYWLNTVNPFSYVRTALRINKLKPDVIIFQWVHPYFAPAYWTICKFLSKKIKIIFLCHNILPHEKFPMEKLLTKTALRKANAYMVMSETEEREIKNLLGECLVKRFYLPVFNLLSTRPEVTKHIMRRELGLSDTDYVLLFFGYVRDYKGLRVLLEAYPEVAKSIPETVLIVAGEFNTSEKNEYVGLIDTASIRGGRIITVGDYVPDADVEKYFTACDVVVLPYISATQSAVVPTAYMFERPVITTDVGGLPEVVIDEKTGYIVPPGDSNALARAVIKFNEHMGDPRFSENIRVEVEKYSWDRLVDSVGEIHFGLQDGCCSTEGCS